MVTLQPEYMSAPNCSGLKAGPESRNRFLSSVPGLRTHPTILQTRRALVAVAGPRSLREEAPEETRLMALNGREGTPERETSLTLCNGCLRPST